MFRRDLCILSRICAFPKYAKTIPFYCVCASYCGFVRRKKNMSITVESYIGKVSGKEGVKLEQQYLVGENGLELMSHHPLEDIK